jgi:hypothetical protein
MVQRMGVRPLKYSTIIMRVLVDPLVVCAAPIVLNVTEDGCELKCTAPQVLNDDENAFLVIAGKTTKF